MIFKNTTIRGPFRYLPTRGVGGVPSQEGWAPATQGPAGPANHNPNSLANKGHGTLPSLLKKGYGSYPSWQQ